MKKATWTVKIHTVTGEGKTTIENGIKTYTPCTGWVEVKTFSDFAEADEWVCIYAREHGVLPNDIKLTRTED
ncbi:MAG: hypothetical protein HDT42_09115 [Ruminococcaceae bacterium]|nr:hypothetical protein [Oscillospiraceae bacterium]